MFRDNLSVASSRPKNSVCVFHLPHFHTRHNLSVSNNILCVCFWCNSPPAGQGLLIHEVSRSHTTTQDSRLDPIGRAIRSSQRPLPNNTKHSQQTDTHAPGGIRTHNLSRRAAADPHLRPRGYWDRQS